MVFLYNKLWQASEELYSKLFPFTKNVIAIRPIHYQFELILRDQSKLNYFLSDTSICFFCAVSAIDT